MTNYYQRYYFKDGQYVGMRPYVGDTLSDAVDAANAAAAKAAADQAAADQAAGRLNPSGGIFNYPAASPNYVLIGLAGLAAAVLYLQLSGRSPLRFLGVRR